ncbi:MAG: MmcQ/YjbR family DNA-binding protein [Clostridia bacterium]|nr:MmcQ/YjbR family DNA-binding protein [Clostridia bacterium]
MREIEIKKGKVSVDSLLRFGFEKCNENYIYSCNIIDNQMRLTFLIAENGKLFSRLVDEFDEEYTLHLNEGASGEFVGRVKCEYESKLNKVLDGIIEYNCYKSKEANEIIEYIRLKYNSELEFLWNDDNAIARRTDNKKWYIVFMTIPKSKLGLKSNDRVEVINLRLTEENVAGCVDNMHFFPAYHMNKRYWITVMLDSEIDTGEILKLVDESYNLVSNKRKS